MSAIKQLKQEIEILKKELKELKEEKKELKEEKKELKEEKEEKKELKLIDFISKNSIYSDEYKIKYITDYFNYINFLHLDEDIDKSIKFMTLFLLNSNEIFNYYKQAYTNEELRIKLGRLVNNIILLKDINIKKLCDYVLFLYAVQYTPYMDVDVSIFNEESKKLLISFIRALLVKTSRLDYDII